MNTYYLSWFLQVRNLEVAQRVVWLSVPHGVSFKQLARPAVI